METASPSRCLKQGGAAWPVGEVRWARYFAEFYIHETGKTILALQGLLCSGPVGQTPHFSLPTSSLVSIRDMQAGSPNVFLPCQRGDLWQYSYRLLADLPEFRFHQSNMHTEVQFIIC